MNKMLSIVSALSLAATALVGFATPAAANHDGPASRDQINEYCRLVAANSPAEGPQFGNCVGYWNSNPHALPAQTCKYYREVGIITQELFPECIAYLRDLEE